MLDSIKEDLHVSRLAAISGILILTLVHAAAPLFLHVVQEEG